ncbi:3-coathanger stack domain-containing protein [Runella slithyformis]|nr:3-coathanger stack domain-containing protein [Runella slithyformis]
MNRFILLSGILLFAFFYPLGAAYAQHLVAWELSSLSGVTSGAVHSSTNADGISRGILSRGAGINATSITAAYSSNGWYSTTAPTTLANAVANNDYYQFTVPIEAGMTADITGIQAYFQASGTGPGSVTLRSSVDGFMADLGTVSIPTASVLRTFTVSLSGLTGTVTFRLYGYGNSAGGTNPGAGGTLRIGSSPTASADDLTVMGNVDYDGITPFITSTPSALTGFSTVLGMPSSVQSYMVSGRSLSDALVMTTQNETIEISTSESGPFGKLIALAPSAGEVTATVVYVRLTGVGTGVFSNEFIEHSSTGALPRTVAVSGTVNDPNTVTAIGAARAQPVNTPVTVGGRITAQLGGLVYVQDATGGIPVFSSALARAVSVGDSVRVTGTRQDFNGQKQLGGVVIFTKYEVPSFVPTPVIITPDQFPAFEGRLVKVENEAFRPDYTEMSPQYLYDTAFVFIADNNYQLRGEAVSHQLRVSFFTDIAGSYVPDNTFSVIGVVGVFNSTYQLFPRSRNDFIPALVPYVNGAGNSLPADSTLDIVSWNIEWFGNGAPGNGPSDEAGQFSNVLKVLRTANADIYVVQEVSDIKDFHRLRDSLSVNGYTGSCSKYTSNLLNGQTTTINVVGQTVSCPSCAGHPMPIVTYHSDSTFQRSCIIYKSALVTLVSEQPLLRLTPVPSPYDYPSDWDNFWASGRYPYLWVVDAAIGGITKRLHLVGIHAKANTAPLQESYERRKYDVKVLRDSLNVQYATANIVLLGDYNDDVDVTVANVSSTESTYKTIVEDVSRFRTVTTRLSDMNFRSYLTRRNVIDHISVSNELFDNYVDGSGDLLLPFKYISNYGSSTSDHLPVIARFRLRDCPVSHNFVERIISNPVNYKTSLEITSSALLKSNANVAYEAGRAVLLKPGFHTETGTVFRASIEGCSEN